MVNRFLYSGCCLGFCFYVEGHVMKNLRMNLSCWLIGLAIKTMPKDWQTDKAVKNLISTKAIKTRESH